MSTDAPAWLTEATSLLNAASGPSGAVTAVAGLLTEGLKLSEPLISDDETHKYDNAYQARIQKAVQLLSQPDSPDRDQQLVSFVSGLCIAAECPYTGGVSDAPLIGIRVSTLLALLTAAAGKIRDDSTITGLYAGAAKQSAAEK